MLAFVCFRGRAPQEPVYHGKSVTAWARDMNSSDPNVRNNAASALQAIGTNGIPYLVITLNRRDPVFRKPFLSLAPKLPLWARQSFLRGLKPFDAFNDRLAAIQALIAFGTNAPVAPLVNALHDPQWQIASLAATALGKTGRPAVPDLIRALACIKQAAALANQELGLLDREKTDVIVKACEEIRAGKLHAEFVRH